MRDDDTDWMIRLGVKRYPPEYDPIGTEQWFRNIVLKSPMLFFPYRSENAFIIGMISCLPWLPAEFECNVIAACADDGAMWQVFPLLRASVDWARKRKCNTWRIVSETEFDFCQIAKRIGATEVSPRYVMRL
jgi:hypothetical protein